MIDIIAQHQKEIADICRHLQVRRLEIFGSAARGNFDPNHSDLDFLVDDAIIWDALQNHLPQLMNWLQTFSF